MSTKQKYGPQTEQVEALLASIRNLTPAQIKTLGETWYAAWYARGETLDAAWYARDEAWYAARDATLDEVWAAARDATLDEVWAATRDATLDEVWDVARSAALALIARHLIGAKFTQADYDLLTSPWRKVIGPIHPDDADVEK